MKPIKIEITNIGPFCGTNILDFSELGDFFLITGQTGAGKSTIFDCMFYALYGTIPGAKKDVTFINIKSQFAKEEDRCFVRFTFQIKNKQYRIFREPAWLKISSRTGKETKVAETILIEEINSETKTTAITNKMSEADDFIKKLIGLSPTEFSSIILLPQGQFADFLRQGTTDRQETLQKLFPVEDYDKVSKEIRKQANEKSSSLLILENQLTNILKTFSPENYKTDFSSLQDLIKKIQTEESILEEKTLALSQEEDLIVRKNNTEKKLQEQIKIQSRLLQDLPQITEKQKTIANAAQGRNFKIHYDNFFNLKQKLESKTKTLKELENKIFILSQKKSQLENESTTYESNKTQNLEIEKQISILQEVVNQKTRITLIEERIQKITTEIEKTKTDILKTQDKQKELQDIRERFEEVIQALPELSDENYKLREDFSQIKNTLEIFNKIEEKENAINLLITEKEKAFLTLSEEEKNLQVLKEKLREAQEKDAHEKQLHELSILSSQLKEGTPCPVCGSTSHPAPAKSHTTFLASDEINAFENAVNLQSEKLNKINADYNLVVSKLSNAQTELAEIKNNLTSSSQSFKSNFLKNEIAELKKNYFSKTSEKLLSEIKTIENKIAKAQNANSQFKVLDENIKINKREQNDLQEKLKSKETILNALNLELAPLTENHKKAMQNSLEKNPEALLQKSINDSNILKEKTKKYETETKITNEEFSKITGILSAEKLSYKNLQEEEASAKELFTTTLNDFSVTVNTEDYNTLLSYAISIEEEKSIREYINEYEIKKSETETLIKSLTDGLNSILVNRSLDDVQKDMASVKEKRNNLKISKSQNEIALNNLMTTKKQYDALCKERENSSNDLQTLQNLANDLNGVNPKAKTFTTWLLGIYLEEITKYATIRLNMMSNGRYTLLLNPDYKKGNAKAGLDLQIFDSYTGKTRPCNTLSGGETFMTSISLALGLADSIQSNSGGIQLDSIFIDEGFGTLDEETLELSLNILDEIKGTRTVGIISHVSELQNRIDSVVKVEKTNNGSHICVGF